MTLVLAHRGARREAPENTIPAFARALELGADGVELDVRRTRDGQLVVRHDAEDPRGAWVERTAAEIRGADPSVPILSEALDACRGAIVNIEIKNSPRDPDWDPADRAAELVVACLADRAGADRVLVSAFNLATVDRVRSLAPHVATALLTFAGDPLADLLTAEAHGHRALHPYLGQLAGATAGALAARARDRGMAVNVWTVNDPDDIARLGAAGVDGICTDVPDVALSVLGRRA
jgi:glycerophosphoryl diester phosphodiesterase